MTACEEPRWAKPGADPALTSDEIAATAASIAAVQLANGMIPWFPGGHADPWNHVEAAMALAVGGLRAEAERGYGWLARTQHADGSWCCYYVEDGVEESRRDTNVIAYVATGVWHHYLLTDDRGFLEWAWPMVRAAINFSLSHQLPGGELVWAVSPDERLPDYALVTGSSSAYFSLRCAIAVAEEVGDDQPEWEMAAGRLAHAVAFRREHFEPKDRWAMDWYYPVLSGALSGAAARAQMASRWEEFIMEGLGVRCVSDSPWVTAAETAECVMALDAVGWQEDARRLFGWVQNLRHEDGSYYTGMVHPQRVHFPGGERSTYTSAAVVLAAHALDSTDAPAGLFRGEGLPSGVAIPAPALSEASETERD